MQRMCKINYSIWNKRSFVYLSDKYANSENNIASRKLLDTCKVTYKKMHIDDEMKNIEIKL